MPTSTISPAAADALRSATADERSITLHCGQLPRGVYTEVDKALRRIAGGGRWDRRAQAHLYGEDPRPALRELVGDDPDADLAMPADADKEASFWRTPRPVVEEMLDRIGILDVPSGAPILEPSAGDGAIADEIVRAGRVVVCVEPDPRRAAALEATGHVVIRSTLEDYAEVESARFAAVVMNPPFTLPGRPTAWADHVELALGLLRPGGRLIAVLPTSYRHRDTRRIVALRNRVAELGGTWAELEDGAFVESGTGVRTGLLLVTVPEETR